MTIVEIAASYRGRLDVVRVRILDLAGRRLEPLGQLREALAIHTARLNASSSDICLSRSIEDSRLRERDLAQTDIK
jgi:hypothetical protein